MLIHWLECVESTQVYLADALRSGELEAPVAVVAARQNAGKGSRGNVWQSLEGNLFFSFAISRSDLPEDLKLESSSIYFTYLLKETLSDFGSAVWLKWPNDFYIEEKKIGGAITTLVNDDLICGIGLNLEAAPKGFSTLDIVIQKNLFLEKYFQKLEKFSSWKQIFSKYRLEFDKSKTFSAHHNDQKISLEKAKLLCDGSIEDRGQRIYSLR